MMGLTATFVLTGPDQDARPVRLRPEAGSYRLPDLLVSPWGASPQLVQVMARDENESSPGLQQALVNAYHGLSLPSQPITRDTRLPGPSIPVLDVQPRQAVRLLLKLVYFDTQAPGYSAQNVPYLEMVTLDMAFEPETTSAATAVDRDATPTVNPPPPAPTVPDVPRHPVDSGPHPAATVVPTAVVPAAVVPAAAGPAAAGPAGRSVAAEDPGSPRTAGRPESHHGFVAVDFGTSASTVTLLDREISVQMALPEAQVEALRAGLSELLADRPPADHENDPEDDAGAEWAELLTEIAADLSGRPADDPAKMEPSGGDPALQLRRAIDARAEAEEVRLHEILRLLEQLSGYSSEHLREWLSHRLHHCYDAAFAVPPLRKWGLHQVVLDPAGHTVEIPSRAELTGVHPVKVRLGVAIVGSGQLGRSEVADGPRVFEGLKEEFDRLDDVKTRSDGVEIRVGDLIAASYRDLIDRTNRFIMDPSAQRRLDRRPVNHVVATYPAMASLRVRSELPELVRDALGVSLVETSYDEAVGAAFFFLMRDIGANSDLGVESFRARSRPIPGTVGTWRRNVLVVDVGGGTTDIALITFTLSDVTPPLDGADERFTGRYYTIVPKLRGSSGHAQLGGNHITLLVFHWLKLTLADALLGCDPARFATTLPDSLQDDTGRYRPGSLLEHGSSRLPLPTWLTDLVEEIVPTQWKAHPERREAFQRLWNEAETAKIELGRLAATGGEPDAYTVPADRLGKIVSVLRSGPDQQQWSEVTLEKEVTLDVGRFEQLARPPVIKIVELANGLVSQRFRDSGEYLDELILTGKASSLPLVEEMFTALFGAGRGGQDRFAWSPQALTVERTYAKNATSIGACWAENLRQFGHKDPANAQRLLRDGHTVIDVSVDNLFRDLPSTFVRVGQEKQKDDVILRAGDQLHIVDARHGTRVRRFSGPLTPTYQIEREVEGGEGHRWGSFRYAEHESPDRPLDPSIWPGKINTMLEMSHELTPVLHLWHGTQPHYTVEGEPLGNVGDAAAKLQERGAASPSGAVRAATTYELVVGIPAGDTTHGTIVFPQVPVDSGGGSGGWPGEGSGEEADADPRLPDRFRSGRAMARAGILSAEPLPPPPRSGKWTFHLRSTTTNEAALVGEALQPAGARDVACWVTLDDNGDVRIHPGGPPFVTADTLKDVEIDQGAVFGYRLDEKGTGVDPALDPFSGEQ